MVEKFLIRYPEFSDVNPEKIQLYFDDAKLELSQKIWGNLYEQGLHALVAHLLYINGGHDKDGASEGQPAQVVASESANGLSVSYGGKNTGLAGTFGSYEATSYGQRYLELRKLTGVHALVVR